LKNIETDPCIDVFQISKNIDVFFGPSMFLGPSQFKEEEEQKQAKGL